MQVKNNIRNSFNKAAHSYNEYAMLQKEVAFRLSESINDFKINPKYIADLGCGSGFLTKHLAKRFVSSEIFALDFAENMLAQIGHSQNIHKICADCNYLPFSSKSIDFIASNLMLQWCDNFKTQFTKYYQILSDNGLIAFTSFGVDTLFELKRSWSLVKDCHNHVNNFEDIHNIGDILLQIGYKNPVIRMEKIVLTYQEVKDVLIDLKKIGANFVANRSVSLTGKQKFNKMVENYESFRVNGKIPATFEVIYIIAWKK